MTVDFAWARTPRMRVARLRWKGHWSDRKVRSQFERIERWARTHRLATGRWVFREFGGSRWEAAIEIRRAVHGSSGVGTTTYPAADVARVVFDPDAVAPRVVYHALSDWLRWRKKEKGIRRVLGSREVYSGNPWTNHGAWARTEVQFVVRK